MAITTLFKISLIVFILSQRIQAQAIDPLEQSLLSSIKHENSNSFSGINTENQINPIGNSSFELSVPANLDYLDLVDTLHDKPLSNDTAILIHYIHAVFMVIIWGFGLDLAMMVARYNKAYANYTKIHGNLMLIILAMTFISELSLLIIGIVRSLSCNKLITSLFRHPSARYV